MQMTAEEANCPASLAAAALRSQLLHCSCRSSIKNASKRYRARLSVAGDGELFNPRSTRLTSQKPKIQTGLDSDNSRFLKNEIVDSWWLGTFLFAVGRLSCRAA